MVEQEPSELISLRRRHHIRRGVSSRRFCVQRDGRSGAVDNRSHHGERPCAKQPDLDAPVLIAVGQRDGRGLLQVGSAGIEDGRVPVIFRQGFPSPGPFERVAVADLDVIGSGAQAGCPKLSAIVGDLHRHGGQLRCSTAIDGAQHVYLGPRRGIAQIVDDASGQHGGRNQRVDNIAEFLSGRYFESARIPRAAPDVAILGGLQAITAAAHAGERKPAHRASLSDPQRRPKEPRSTRKTVARLRGSCVLALTTMPRHCAPGRGTGRSPKDRSANCQHRRHTSHHSLISDIPGPNLS